MIMQLQRFLYILMFFCEIGSLLATLCFRKASQVDYCRSCSWETYNSQSENSSDTQEFNALNCAGKITTTRNQREVVVTNANCTGACSDYFDFVYTDVGVALREETHLARKYIHNIVKIYIHGEGPHYANINEGETFFQRIKAEINVLPLYCSKISVSGCIKPYNKAILKFTSLKWQIFAHNILSFEGLSFDFLGSNIAATNQKQCINQICCTEELLNSTKSESNPCGLLKQEIFASESLLLGKKGFIVSEKILDEPGASTPSIWLSNIQFTNLYVLDAENEVVTIIIIKQQATNIFINNITLSNMFLIKGLITFEEESYTEEEIDSFSVYQKNLEKTNNDTITIKGFLLNSYNKFLMKNTGEGGLAVFNFYLWEGVFSIENFTVIGFNANHLKQVFFRLHDTTLSSLNNLYFKDVVNIGVVYSQDSIIVINTLYTINFVCGGQSSFYFVNTSSTLENFIMIDTWGSVDGVPFLKGVSSFINLMTSSLVRGTNISFIFQDGEGILKGCIFKNISFDYALIAAGNSNMGIHSSYFENISGNFWIFEAIGREFTLANSSGVRFYSEAAFNFEDCTSQSLIASSFTLMTKLGSFFSPSRLFYTFIVKNCTVSDSEFGVFYSFYTENNNDPSIRFENVILQNLIITDILLEFCCTNFTFINSLAKDIYLDGDTGRCIGAFEVQKHYLIENSEFYNVGWLMYPKGGLDLTLIMYRCIFSLWFANSFTWRNSSYKADVDISAPTGIIAAPNFDESIYISGLTVDLLEKNSENCVKVILLCYPAEIILENSYIRNAGCANSAKELTFFHNHGAVGFFNFPQYGGEKANTKKVKIFNVTFDNCFCVSGGALFLVNYNYLSITNCKFFNSLAEDNGGHLMVVSANELNFTDNTLRNSSSSIGGAIFFLYLVEIRFYRCSISNSESSNNAGGLYLDSIEQSFIYDSSFTSLNSVNRGGALYLDQTIMFMSNMSFQQIKSQYGGAIYITFGSEMEASNLSFSGASALIGGVFFIEDSSNFIISSVNFSNCESLWLSSVLHLKSFKNFSFTNINMVNLTSGFKSALYIRTFDSSAVANIKSVNCLRSEATLGSFLLYEGACNIILRNIYFGSSESTSIFEFNQPSTIRVDVRNITIENSNVETIWNSKGLTFYLEDFKFNNIKLRRVGFSLDSCRVDLNKGTFIDLYKDFIDTDYTNSDIYIIQGDDLTLNAKDISIKRLVDSIGRFSIPFLESNTLNSLNFSRVSLNSFMNSKLPWIQTVMGNLSITECNFTDYDQKLLSSTDSQNVVISEIVSIGSTSSEDLSFQTLLGFAGNTISTVSITKFSIFEKKNGLIVRMNSINVININSIKFGGGPVQTENLVFKELRFAYIKYCRQLNITDSQFSNLFANSGAFLQLEGELKSQNSSILINKSLFKNIIGFTGSAIITSGSFALLLQGNSFLNCSALSLGSSLMSGIGGVIYISRSQEPSTIILQNNKFQGNKAERFAPTLFSEARIANISDNIFEDNSDRFGFTANISSYPLKFKGFINNNRSELGELSVERYSFASGQAFNLTVIVFDTVGNILLYDNVSHASMEIDINGEQGSAEVIIKKNSAKSTRGFFEFTNLLIKAEPNMDISTLLTVTLLEERCCENDIDILKAAIALTQKVNLFSRPCLLGEIKTVENICFPCPRGTYSIIDPMGKQENGSLVQKCYQCPENARCERDLIVPVAGYWKASKNSTLILRCEIPEACLGGPEYILNITDDEIIKGQCIKGHFGNLCNDCDTGYGKFSDTSLCQNCKSESTSLIIKGIVIGVSVIVYITISTKIFSRIADPNRGVSFPSMLFKILLSHFHQVSVVTFMEKLTIIPSLEFFLNTQKLLSFLNQDFISMDCMVSADEGDRKMVYVYKVMATLVLPIVLGVVSSVFWILLFLAMVLLSPESRLKNSQTIKRILIGFAISIYVFYPMIIQSCFSLLNCIALDDTDTKEYLFIAPNMDCWDKQHIFYILTVFIPGILVIGFIFPLFMYYSLSLKYSSSKILPDSSSNSPTNKATVIRISPTTSSSSRVVAQRISSADAELYKSGGLCARMKYLYGNLVQQDIFRFFHEGYREEFYFWELTIFARKFVLTMVASLNQLLKAQTKNILILITLFMNFSYCLSSKAFRDARANRLEQLSLFSTIITCMCMVFISNLDNVGWKTFFGVITIIINTLFIATISLFIMNHILVIFKARQASRNPKLQEPKKE